VPYEGYACPDASSDVELLVLFCEMTVQETTAMDAITNQSLALRIVLDQLPRKFLWPHPVC